MINNGSDFGNRKLSNTVIENDRKVVTILQ